MRIIMSGGDVVANEMVTPPRPLNSYFKVMRRLFMAIRAAVSLLVFGLVLAFSPAKQAQAAPVGILAENVRMPGVPKYFAFKGQIFLADESLWDGADAPAVSIAPELGVGIVKILPTESCVKSMQDQPEWCSNSAPSSGISEDETASLKKALAYWGVKSPNPALQSATPPQIPNVVAPILAPPTLVPVIPELRDGGIPPVFETSGGLFVPASSGAIGANARAFALETGFTPVSLPPERVQVEGGPTPAPIGCRPVDCESNVPEPGTLALGATGVLLLFLARRRRVPNSK
jgi:PEP-CTERM motif